MKWSIFYSLDKFDNFWLNTWVERTKIGNFVDGGKKWSPPLAEMVENEGFELKLVCFTFLVLEAYY
jgi:hypothetical protein